jgi:pilus assembly protein CpaE
MITKRATDDEFDAGFEADDEFTAPSQTDWDVADPLIEPAPEPAAIADADPFEAAVGPHPIDADAEALSEAGADAPNPVGALIAGAEAAFSAVSGGGESNVPRISVHIFCELPTTAGVAEQAKADRRMARASTTVRPGGLAAAVEYFQNQPTPSLVIVESQDPPAQMIGLLDRLAEVCDPGTKVVVIGRANDIALYRELMRRGVSEYLVPPFGPLDLIGSITTLYADPSAPFLGRSVAFVGAKGGVGASTIAHNFAHAITEHMQSNAVIVDLDLPFGTAGLDFNQDPLHGVVDALSQPDRLDPVLMERMMARCTDKLSLFAAPATLDDDYEITPEAFEEVTAKIRTTAQFVILDLPHLWSGWMRRMLLSGDDVIIVATPDLASLRNAKNMVDLVKTSRPNDEPPRLVLNMVGVPGRPEIPVKDFGDALGIDPSLVLGFEPKLFGQAANNGQMISQVNTRSKSVDGINHLAQLVARREAPVALKKSFLASLRKGK